MSLSDEIGKLQELRDSGVLTDEEFARAKAKALSSPSPETNAADGAALQRHLRQIRLQNELERLDREWEMERESYMSTDKYGSRHVPSGGGSLVGGVIAGGFGVFWIIQTTSAPAGTMPAIFPLFGVLLIVLGVGGAIHGFIQADAYRLAHERYQQRRAELLAQDEPKPR